LQTLLIGLKNKTMETNLGGRPPFFETEQELQNKIDEYFATGMKVKKVIVGKAPNNEVVELPVPTITGLAYFLGFESRQSFYDYEKIDKFTYTVKRARTLIEIEYETLLHSNNVAGAIFALKNFGWTDKQEIEHSGGLPITLPKLVFDDLNEG